MLYTSKRTVGELDLAELSLQGVILASGVGEKSAKFPCGGACARLPLVSQANPVLIFVTHCWENSDDYLRVFEYLESQRNFFYRNYSTPEQRPQGDREALRESLRKQIAPSEAVIGLSSLFDAHQELLMRIEQARQPDDRFGWGDLLAQTLAQRLPVALRALLGGAVVAIEEVPLTLQIFEYPQVVVAVLPAVGHEDEDWIGL